MACPDDDKLNNGYPFRDDIINFYLLYKGQQYYFEFPLLMDKSYLVQEIKTRTGVRGTFSIRWKDDPKPEINEEKQKIVRKEKPKSFAELNKEKKGEEICIHSSHITTESMVRFCGQTLIIIEGNEKGGNASWKQISLSEYNRKLIEERRKPFDCPP